MPYILKAIYFPYYQSGEKKIDISKHIYNRMWRCEPQLTYDKPLTYS